MPLRIMFVVQGEGRGHLSQALALKSILENAGYSICAVVAGISKYRTLPEYFTNGIGDGLITIQSPNLRQGSDAKSIRPGISVLETLLNIKTYRRSLKMLNQAIVSSTPDLIINFYEPLVGLNAYFRKYQIPVLSIAHQFMFLHPDFRFPKGKVWSRLQLRLFTHLVANGSSLLIGLSIYPLSSSRKVLVLPPLLRREILDAKSSEGDFLLVYLLNRGYIPEVMAFHRKHPKVRIHCFTDSIEYPEGFTLNDTLTFHHLNDQLFIDLMASSRALVTTAGFESVCEAMLLGKPVLMVPVKNHIEQFINSRDAVKSGAGMLAERFDIEGFLKWLPQYSGPEFSFREWAQSFDSIFIQILEQANLQPAKPPNRNKATIG
jgi:uncharacterized protein (TIGR00661 family)